jgi:mannose-6-phosphate isomerase-like protein (cupin superfamily)
MRIWLKMAAGISAAALAATASAQFLGQSVMPAENKMPDQVWSPKPTALPPYVAPNKPLWKISEIMAAHKGKADWVQPIVRNSDQEADYISNAPGTKTKAKFYTDDRLVFIVQAGTIKVNISGYPEFTATKGFMVNVPFRHVYTLETVGNEPSVRFEVRQAGAIPAYPGDVQPDAIPGFTYQKVTASPGPAKESESNPIYVDFLKQVVQEGGKPSKFVWDDHFTSNILRGAGAPVPPDTNKGHFHVRMTEFWFVQEGHIGIKIEGLPYFVADQGDIITAQAGRWHRAGNDPSAPMSTRIPFNPRPPIMHNFEPAH